MNTINNYYNNKTEHIIEKYGSDLRIHYHTGIFNDHLSGTENIEQIRYLMYISQERVLDLLSEYYPDMNKQCKVLDVGCGLGGGSLYWAMKKNAYVTSISNAKQHLPLVNEYAQKAQVSELITTLYQDAHTMPGHENYDMAISIESSCYLDRYVWMKRIFELLVPGGILQIFDNMITDEEKDPTIESIEKHWHTNMGTTDEYNESGEQAGLILIHEKCLNDAVTNFWSLAIAWNELIMKDCSITLEKRERLQNSLKHLHMLQDCHRERKITVNHLIFRKPL